MALHTDFYTIKPTEITTQNQLTTADLFDFMQQSASKNAETLGVGVEKMRESNLAWVLNRLKLTVERYPKLGETVALSTYPVRIDKYFVYRDFQLQDNQGVQIANAVSVWLLLDLDKRTMSSVPSFVHDIEYPIIDTPLPPISGKILPLKIVDFSVKRTVIAEDVDFNQHTSNVSYVKWLVEAMPLGLQNNCFVKELDINYRAECYLGEPIIIETYQKEAKRLENGFYTEGGYFQQKILRERDKKDLVWANVLWATV